MGTSQFARLRIGIGRPVTVHNTQIDYVLGVFTQEEAKLLPGILKDAVACIKRLLAEEFSKVASDVNRTTSLKIEKDLGK